MYWEVSADDKFLMLAEPSIKKARLNSCLVQAETKKKNNKKNKEEIKNCVVSSPRILISTIAFFTVGFSHLLYNVT